MALFSLIILCVILLPNPKSLTSFIMGMVLQNIDHSNSTLFPMELNKTYSNYNDRLLIFIYLKQVKQISGPEEPLQSWPGRQYQIRAVATGQSGQPMGWPGF